MIKSPEIVAEVWIGSAPYIFIHIYAHRYFFFGMRYFIHIYVYAYTYM